jgi:hypothetical protein
MHRHRVEPQKLDVQDYPERGIDASKLLERQVPGPLNSFGSLGLSPSFWPRLAPPGQCRRAQRAGRSPRRCAAGLAAPTI